MIAPERLMTNLLGVRRPVIVLIVCAASALAGACDTTPPAPATTVVVPVQPPVPERPWTVGELTYHPCAVLDADDTARFVLGPEGVPETPPNSLPACSWHSVQTSEAGAFSVRFALAQSDSTDSEQQAPGARQITIGGERAVVKPDDPHTDGTRSGCGVRVRPASGGSFSVGVAAGGVRTGVDWDPCAKAVDIATVVAGKMD
ncbi:DUF3558 family protein [Nocardia carnea]|uniref:DUF3558 family protein n=1 Tax=Nocardia carnea TaxID=37328 RepID=UPI0024552733|nr:DUF3558 family protein [Nocardia carnea]